MSSLKVILGILAAGLTLSGCMQATTYEATNTTNFKPHDKELLAKIRALSNEYQAPDSACPTYRALYHGLEEFERDLHHHVHLENNILFPRAIATETGG